jgi:UDP-N-acetyl-D-mannosaminuronic acid dehydrogenase
VIEKIRNAALSFEREEGREPVVACMGLAFKPDIDDLRESPAFYITLRLISDGLNVLAVEPNITFIEGLELVNYEEAIERADIIVFLVAHKEFKYCVRKKFGSNENEVLDFCGVLNEGQLRT